MISLAAFLPLLLISSPSVNALPTSESSRSTNDLIFQSIKDQLPFLSPSAPFEVPSSGLGLPHAFESDSLTISSHVEENDDFAVLGQGVEGRRRYKIQHKDFKGHAIRAVQPKMCESVDQWSGYLDTPSNRHFFFWFFASRSSPTTDPIMLWLNGGPGCSSSTGNLMELGPCAVNGTSTKDGKLELNPWSWNSNSSIIFLDQPVGTGYSYKEKEDRGVWTTEDAAVDVYAFLQMFFEAFRSQFANTPFHISGESYAGRYIPTFADYIVQQNKNNDELPKINLASVLIGNGMTDQKRQYAAYYPTVCSNISGYGPYLPESTCAQMLHDLPKCTNLFQKCEDNPSNNITCMAAVDWCEDTQAEVFYKTGRNAYDMEKFGAYPQEQWIHDFLNRNDTRHELGVDNEPNGKGVKEFIGCSDPVEYRFSSSGDRAQASYPHVANILEAGVAVLTYFGNRDFICNWLGGQSWTLALEWSGKEGFNKQDLKPWYVPGSKLGAEQAGSFRTFENFTFATVDRSGHFVPTDRPEQALAMANAWIHKGPSAFTQVLSHTEA